MRPLTYYVGTSLDGRIAGPEGEVDVYPLSDDHLEHMTAEYPEVLPTHARRRLGIDDAGNRRFDTVVMGSGTYQPALEIGVTDPYEHLRTYVASTRDDLPQDPAVTIVADPLALVRQLKAEDDASAIWLAGGGRIAATLVDEIDQLILKVYPVLLGDGVPVLAGAFSPRAFTLVASASFASGCTVLTYERNDTAGGDHQA